MKYEIEVSLSEQAKVMLEHLRKDYGLIMSDEKVINYFVNKGWVIGDQIIYLEMFMKEAFLQKKGDKK